VSHISSTFILEVLWTVVTTVLPDPGIGEPNGWNGADATVTLADEYCDRTAGLCTSLTGDCTWDGSGVVDVRLKWNFELETCRGFCMHRDSSTTSEYWEDAATELEVYSWFKQKLFDRSCSFNVVCTWFSESSSDNGLQLEPSWTELCAFWCTALLEQETWLGFWNLVGLEFLTEVTSSFSDCLCNGSITTLFWFSEIVLAWVTGIRALLQFVTGGWMFGRCMSLHGDSTTVGSRSFELSSLIFKVVGEPSRIASLWGYRRTRLLGVMFR